MLKKTALLCALCVVSAPLLAEPFDGFYVGADVGFTQAKFKAKQSSTLDVFNNDEHIIHIPTQNNNTITDNSVIGNFDIGFSKVLKQHVYLGLEASADLQNLEGINNAVLTEQNSELAIPQKTRVQLENEFALTFNPGVVFNKTTLLYGKVGPAWGRFNSRSEASYTQNLGTVFNTATESSTGSHYETGLRLGLGIEHYVADNLSLKLEFINTNYYTIDSPKSTSASLESGVPEITGGIANSSKIRASNSSVLLGFNYRFG